MKHACAWQCHVNCFYVKSPFCPLLWSPSCQPSASTYEECMCLAPSAVTILHDAYSQLFSSSCPASCSLLPRSSLLQSSIRSTATSLHTAAARAVSDWQTCAALRSATGIPRPLRKWSHRRVTCSDVFSAETLYRLLLADQHTPRHI